MVSQSDNWTDCGQVRVEAFAPPTCSDPCWARLHFEVLSPPGTLEPDSQLYFSLFWHRSRAYRAAVGACNARRHRIQTERLRNIQNALLSCCSVFFSTCSSGYSSLNRRWQRLSICDHIAQQRGECLCWSRWYFLRIYKATCTGEVANTFLLLDGRFLRSSKCSRTFVNTMGMTFYIITPVYPLGIR